MKHILIFLAISFLFVHACKPALTFSSKTKHEKYELISPVNSYYATYGDGQYAVLDIKKKLCNSDSIVAVLYDPTDESPYKTLVLLEGTLKSDNIKLYNTTHTISLEGIIKDTIITSNYKNKLPYSHENIVWNKRKMSSSNGSFIIASDIGFRKEISLTGYTGKGIEPCTGKYMIMENKQLDGNQYFTILFQYPSLGFFQGGACGMGTEMLLVTIQVDKNREITMQDLELHSCNNGIESRINDKIVTFEDLKKLWNKNEKITLEINELRKDKVVDIVIDKNLPNSFRKFHK